MPAVLNYGTASAVELNFPADAFVAECAAPRDAVISDPAAAVAAALDAPLDYPPLAAATVPGDRIAITLANDLPQAAKLVAGAVQALMHAGVEPHHITLLQSRSAVDQGASDPRAELDPQVAAEITFLIHDPTDRPSLALLGPSARNEGIYLNREICEADLVLPIGVQRLQEAADYRGAYAGLYPTFSDQHTIERHHQIDYLQSETERTRRREEADDVGWQLGSRLVIQVVPGPGDEILHVLAGDVDAVMAEGQRRAEATWRYHLPRRASLVVASIEGAGTQQSWESVARALAAASRAVSVEGAVALCTDLSTGPGPALMHLAETEDLESALHAIQSTSSIDAQSAWQLAQALRRGTVYLLSQLNEEVVEALGIAPVEQPSQIGRLPQRFDSCIVLANAQHALPIVDNDEELEDQFDELDDEYDDEEYEDEAEWDEDEYDDEDEDADEEE